MGYGVAIAVVTAALAVKYLFTDLGSEHPFVLLPATVIVAAWYGGRGPGLLAAGVAGLGADIPFLPPAGVPRPRGGIFLRFFPPVWGGFFFSCQNGRGGGGGGKG